MLKQKDDLPFDDTTSLGVLLNYVVVLAGARERETLANVEAQGFAQNERMPSLGRVGADAKSKARGVGFKVKEYILTSEAGD